MILTSVAASYEAVYVIETDAGEHRKYLPVVALGQEASNKAAVALVLSADGVAVPVNSASIPARFDGIRPVV